MDGEFCLIGQDNLKNWYRNRIDQGILKPDPEQAKVVDRLQILSDEFSATEDEVAEGLFSRLLKGKTAPKAPRGVYVHGTVGRGKSYLMDGFFLNLPIDRKLRVHFHGFMRHYHADMKKMDGDNDDLSAVASSLANKFDLICFDEFHVSDIADAMILARILEVLVDSGTVLVATSNYHPDDLYPNGLARDRFLPAIELIKERLDVISLDGKTDYRFRALSNAGLYLSPANKANEDRFSSLFDSLSLGMTLKPGVKVSGRYLPAHKRTSDALWLDFDEVCGGNYSQTDYLQIAERFATVFVSGVPRLGNEAQAEATRRFTWLIDVLYDMRVKLVILADHTLEQLFDGEGGEFGRTLSRLKEMQSSEYLAEAVKVPQGLSATQATP